MPVIESDEMVVYVRFVTKLWICSEGRCISCVEEVERHEEEDAKVAGAANALSVVSC